MPPKKKKAKKGSSKEPKKTKKDKSPKKGGKSKSPSKGKGGKGKKGKGKENKPESDSEEEEPPPPTERELWLQDGGILPQMTCGAVALERAPSCAAWCGRTVEVGRPQNAQMRRRPSTARAAPSMR